MALKDRIAEDLKAAMRARDQVRIDTLRSALSAFSYRRVEAGREPDDDEQVAIVRKLVKQRTDSIDSFRKGKREDLVEKESRERDILTALLPRQKSEEELRPLVLAAVAELPENGRNQGAAMKVLMARLRGEDAGLIRKLVAEALGSP